MDDKILFIMTVHGSYVVYHCKCSSSLKTNGFWLTVYVFIVHQLERFVPADEQ